MPRRREEGIPLDTGGQFMTVVNFVTGRRMHASDASLDRAVAGSWLDAMSEAVHFARTINHEVI
jgi:hypothetical protein